jgi:hypothetical protein
LILIKAKTFSLICRKEFITKINLCISSMFLYIWSIILIFGIKLTKISDPQTDSKCQNKMKLIKLAKVKFKNADFVTNLIVFLMLLLAGLQSMSAQCPTPAGDPNVYGADSWIGYVYSGLDANNPPQNAFTSGMVYRGYILQTEQFNQDLGVGSISGANVCGSYTDAFSVRFRMHKNWTPGYYTFTVGGDDGYRLSFDGGTTWSMTNWGYHSYASSTATFFLSGDKDMVLENYDQGGSSQVSFSYTSCGSYSTTPTAISGNTAICNGTSTTLTATGGTLAAGAVYQWGTGTAGSNIMAGQTGESITVSPANNTTYWVRRVDTAPCSMQSAAASQLVTVSTGSTAPTTISGTTTVCLGASTTLTASGGTLASGSVYEWGTGTIGSNIISGQTSAAITVTPAFETTYWVRRTNASPCTATSAVTATVNVNTPAGDQTSYGSNSWIGYVYATINTSNPPTDAFAVPYKGYITEPETFNQNWGSGSVSGTNICGSYDTRFAVRFKMDKNFTPGYYTFTVGGDDGYRLSLDGGATFAVTNWTDHGYASSTSAQYYLSGPTLLVLEFYEQGGDAQVSFNYTSCTDFSSAPTAITGTTTVCSNTSTTLTATGGYAAAGSSYQWGTGTVGSNIITGQTAASITVNLGTASTTYWVRRADPAPCNLTTAAATQLVTVVAPSTQPTGISGTASICAGNSTTLTATGGTLASGAVYQWGTGSIGNNIITGQTAVSITVSPTANTTYWVRKMDAAPCNTITSGPTVNVAVSQLSTAPTSINNAASVCSPVGGITLSAIGGTSAMGSTYQWGTGSVVGTGPIGGQTNSTYYVNPTAVTAYWVRRYDPAPCSTYTNGVTIVVYPASTAPTSLTGTNSICIGASTTLTVSGGTHAVNATYQWGTGGTVGDNIITGQTAASITVSPTTNTTYWVRRVDAAPCSANTSGVTYNVTVNQLSTAPTSINSAASICSPVGGVTLNAIGGTSGSGSATYQWGTGSVAGTNPVAGTNSSLYVNPTTVTTYWVRRYDPAPCSTYTNGVTIVVYPASTAPTSLTGTSPVCSGTNVTLTASGGTHGALAAYEWGTGSAGSNIIAGQTSATLTVAPTATATYWVRRTDSTPCATVTGSVSYTITVNQRSVAPTSITGPSSLCYTAGGGTLTAVGATPGTNATYQWGTGTVGSNIQAGTVNMMYINPSVTTTYWVRLIDPAPCNNTSAAVTFTVSVNTLSSAPTAISGTTSICNGGSTTLTATGGTLGVGAAYQWGTGTNPGTNIIAGQTSVSMTVSPATTTTYWVRRVDGTPCTTATWGPNVTVTVGNLSTAPTAISGAGTAACAGSSYTLTASGGTGTVYQWGTGSTIGSNVIAGQNGAWITVSPTATTTYWVRRYDAAPCNTYTDGVTATIMITAPPGNPTVFGSNQWNVYGYSTGDITLATAVYAGYYTQTTLGFDTTLSWANSASPSGASNWNGCPVPVDNFTFVHKRSGFPCGNYTLTMQNWDDAAELYINGILRWSNNSWSTGGPSGAVGTYLLDSNSTIEVRTRENGGAANAALLLTNNIVAPTAPTAISGSTTICGAASTALTANGGSMGTNGVYEWGTGTPGDNIISGQNLASITVSPTASTTYWVRRKDNICNASTAAITQLVTVNPGTVAGTLNTSTTTICQNTVPSAITLSGQTGNVIKWQYAGNAAFTSGVTDIAVTSATLSPANMGTISATRYYRAVVRNGNCTTEYTTPVTITVPSAVNYTNGMWSATPTETTPVIINSDLTLNANLNVCSCQIKNGVTMTVGPNSNLIVKTALVVEPSANLILEDKASLVQVDDSASDIGSIKVKRNTTPMKNYDYCYWSSPVQGNTLFQLSPLTLADKYYKFDPGINNWSVITGGNQAMEPGKGYIVRAPQGWSVANTTSGIYKALFSGVPNNGVVAATIQKGAGTFNLIGNPYPSAIDIDLFLTDPANTNIISGTIYLWTHNTAISSTIPGNQVYNYNADDYAKYNLTGGIQSANPAITGGSAPTGKVAAGQGFFIEANPALSNGTYSATFKNSMRITGHNDTFYRQSTVSEPQNNIQTQLEKNRFWINITNVNGAYNEVLVGYVTGATNGFDNLFDGKTFPAGNNVSLYSIAGIDNYSIQGRALPFNDSEVIPLGYKTTVANTFTIALENFDGLFAGQNIYLIDHANNTTTNLKEGNYTFASAIGTFNDRFEIRFTASVLGTDSVVFNENSVAIVANNKQVGVRSSKTIESVQVFDLLGRKIFAKDKINATTFKTATLTSIEQVMIVKVTLDGGYEITRKVILD